MEWFADDPKRGQIALTVTALVVAVAIVMLGRKRLINAILFALIWLLLAAIEIPSAMSARPVSQRNACINNLQLIRDAKVQWARENKKLPTEIPTEADLYGSGGSNGFLRRRLACPRGGIYTSILLAAQPRIRNAAFQRKGTDWNDLCVVDKVHVRDFHATVLALLGLNQKLTGMEEALVIGEIFG